MDSDYGSPDGIFLAHLATHCITYVICYIVYISLLYLHLEEHVTLHKEVS